MIQNSDDLEMLIDKYKKMEIEELRASIDRWEENIDFSNKLICLEIAKNELEIKYKERHKQIELLTKSLTSSSRLRRWISSIKTILKSIFRI